MSQDALATARSPPLLAPTGPNGPDVPSGDPIPVYVKEDRPPVDQVELARAAGAVRVGEGDGGWNSAPRATLQAFRIGGPRPEIYFRDRQQSPTRTPRPATCRRIAGPSGERASRRGHEQGWVRPEGRGAAWGSVQPGHATTLTAVTAPPTRGLQVQHRSGGGDESAAVARTREKTTMRPAITFPWTIRPCRRWQAVLPGLPRSEALGKAACSLQSGRSIQEDKRYWIGSLPT